MELNLSNIQGNVVPGFSKDHQAFVFVHVRDGETGRAWLRALQAEIASAEEVSAFNSLFSKLRARRSENPEPDNGVLGVLAATWVNIAWSFRGLQVLRGARETERFPATFKSNRIAASPAYPRADDVHALVIVASDQTDDLEAELLRQRLRLTAFGVEEVTCLRGETLSGELRGHEHFGFKDGISQPRIAGTDFGDGFPVAAGEFVVGHADQEGQHNVEGLPDWVRDGSYLVFHQLQQHVGVFGTEMRHAAQQLGMSVDAIKAGIVGRCPDGTPVQPSSRLSHISRGFAQWLPAAQSARHRLIRRGIPYGTRLAEGERDDGDRGLLFVAYQADIARQFEHVWSQWINGSNFPLPGAGADLLVGQSDGPPRRAASLIPAGQSGGLSSLSVPAFVTPRYGGYFFAPGIEALSQLATNATSVYAKGRE